MSLKQRLLAIREAFRRPEQPQLMSAGHPDVGQAILEVLKRQGMIPPDAQVQVTTLPLTGHGPHDRPGIKPPADPDIDNITWSTWRDTMDNLAPPPGWSACRFGNRRGPDATGFVFGIVKGSFGVWNHPFVVCDEDEEFDGTTQILSCVTYLGTGFGLGIFADKPTAIEAADLAIGLGGWEAMPRDDNSEPAWTDRIKLLQSTWEFNGIDHDENRHCHEGGSIMGGSHGIWTKTAANLLAGKPEKVS